MRLLDDATIVWDKWHAIEEEIVLAVVSVAVFFLHGGANARNITLWKKKP